MDLILWRHCEAEAGVPDESRRLTAIGATQAARMAQWLGCRLPEDCRILVSPAVRAQQTARSLDRKFRTAREVGPAASVAALLAAANWPDAPDSVLVVGHQPTLGRVTSRLLEGGESDRTMVAGAVWWLATRSGWPVRAVLRFAITPDLI